MFCSVLTFFVLSGLGGPPQCPYLLGLVYVTPTLLVLYCLLYQPASPQGQGWSCLLSSPQHPPECSRLVLRESRMQEQVPWQQPCLTGQGSLPIGPALGYVCMCVCLLDWGVIRRDPESTQTLILPLWVE